jgi:hypothetical protein
MIFYIHYIIYENIMLLGDYKHRENIIFNYQGLSGIL